MSLKCPEENFLIDGGSSNKKNTAVYQILPYLKNQGIATLDGIFVSHTDKDHISGIEEILELCAQKSYDSTCEKSDPAGLEYDGRRI